MQKITPFLWFNNNAEEAANFYTSIFKHSKLGNIARYGEGGPGPKGSVMSGTFQIACGRSSPPAEERTTAAGCKTNSASRGKSFQRFSASCCIQKIRIRRNGS